MQFFIQGKERRGVERSHKATVWLLHRCFDETASDTLLLAAELIGEKEKEREGFGDVRRKGVIPFAEGSSTMATAQPLRNPKSPQLQHQQDPTIADDTDSGTTASALP
ncbi:hypothetical protein E2P81_ATG03535 [Venturia nashicola]|nr:hypothetical protein E2P81_ATG03535 [Venturia nashicola]